MSHCSLKFIKLASDEKSKKSKINIFTYLQFFRRILLISRDALSLSVQKFRQISRRDFITYLYNTYLTDERVWARVILSTVKLLCKFFSAILVSVVAISYDW